MDLLDNIMSCSCHIYDYCPSVGSPILTERFNLVFTQLFHQKPPSTLLTAHASLLEGTRTTQFLPAATASSDTAARAEGPGTRTDTAIMIQSMVIADILFAAICILKIVIGMFGDTSLANKLGQPTVGSMRCWIELSSLSPDDATLVPSQDSLQR